MNPASRPPRWGSHRRHPHVEGMAVSDDEAELQSLFSGNATPKPPDTMLEDAAGEVQTQRVAAASMAFAGTQEAGSFLHGTAPGGSQEG